MAEHGGKIERKLYSDWRRAEVQYAEVLAGFGGDGPPPKVKKESALAVSKARNKADQARDKFFKRVLK
ncbi:MAG: hypothetical protein WCF36_17120 [Candidatus Nanopelagicales bacterium]